jgi:hypothetical protein
MPRPPRTASARLLATSVVGVGAALLWVWIRVGFANNDSLFALVWGQQLARGETPQYDLAVAPTPHPLGTLFGLIVSPLGPGTSEDIAVAIGYIGLAAVAFLVYRLGEAWFGRAAGLLAAALIVTREPVLSNGIRAYVDIPYVALVLGAILVETRRRRSGAPVLLLLGIAGLLRPEAWLFSGLYWLWLVRGGELDRASLARLAALAAAAPVIWFAGDAAVTGDPFWSLTQTRHTAEALRRVTGLQNVPITGSRRLGEILREPGLFGALAGVVLTLLWLRDRARLGVAAVLAAAVAFAVLATVGLPIVTRYMLLTAALLSTFVGAAVFGWVGLARDVHSLADAPARQHLRQPWAPADRPRRARGARRRPRDLAALRADRGPQPPPRAAAGSASARAAGPDRRHAGPPAHGRHVRHTGDRTGATRLHARSA